MLTRLKLIDPFQIARACRLESRHLLLGVGDHPSVLIDHILGDRRHVQQTHDRASARRRTGDERQHRFTGRASVERNKDPLRHAGYPPCWRFTSQVRPSQGSCQQLGAAGGTPRTARKRDVGADDGARDTGRSVSALTRCHLGRAPTQ